MTNDVETAGRAQKGHTREDGSEQGQILVTGGSRGLGRAIVERLVRDGNRVAFTYRTGEEEAQQLMRSLHEDVPGAQVAAHAFDLSDDGGAKVLVQELEKAGPIVGLVDNAGAQTSALVAMISDADWERTLDVNLGGPFRCCRAVLPLMVRRRGGSIVNIASLAAERGVAGQGAYAASKAGLLALTRVMAREMGRRGIRVNAVVPGFVETDMTANLPEPAKKGLRAAECLRSGVSADQVASAVAFLLSDAAGGITGESLHVDAGASC